MLTDSNGRSLVNGRLAMTRSIGDLELKPYGVIPVPDIRTVQVRTCFFEKRTKYLLNIFFFYLAALPQIRHGRDAFLVLTTDGINGVMTDQEICDAVQRNEEPSEAAHALTDQALHYSSEDNATAVVVPLGSWGNNTPSASIFYSFGRSMTVSSRFS